MDSLILEFCTWLEHNRGRSPATVHKYAGYLERLRDYCAGRGIEPLEASQEDLEDFTGLHLHRAGLTPRSRRAVVAAVRRFYAWAERTGRVDGNPARHVPYPAAGRRLPVAMELAQAEALLMAPGIDTFLGLRDTTIIATLLGTGIRISGLVALNESDLLWVQEDGHEQLIIRVTEKGKKERLVPAPAETWALMRAYLGHPELEAVDRLLPDGDRVLFVSTNCRTVSEADYHGEARRISHRTINDMLRKHGHAAGVPEHVLHPHAMRHLYGAELAEEDVDLIQRQALLGHADPKSTEIYSHIAHRKLRKTVERANPLRKIRTPVTSLIAELRKPPRS